ncbi:MAG: UDP-N-acetylglucosamine 2-epimerase (non-hydrolyzing) [Coriobacteriia bacterium]|nr:UDP-N-acetylglucosamine 2-epimerase (non-hydrolyzing) [Coriobacteriia bacterium]
MAPVVKTLKLQNELEVKVAVTAQHREMLDQVLELFDITPDYDLNIMSSGQSLEQVTSRVAEGMSSVIKETSPDIILVHGDTTTTFAAALSAFYNKVAVGHVEAGLRTGNKYSPYPEEMNRKITTALTDLHFAPTELNKQNLLHEGVLEQSIFITGNTVIDALHMIVDEDYQFDQGVVNLERAEGKKLILLTCHRRENWGAPMQEIFSAIKDTVGNDDAYEVVFPVHLNPKVQEAARKTFAGMDNIQLIEPLQYREFSNLMNKSYLILSDSGGVQEEAPSLGKPVLVLRDTTERPEAVEAGTVKLAGNRYEQVKTALELVLSDVEVYQSMAQAKNPYGDGTAALRIAKAMAGAS